MEVAMVLTVFKSSSAKFTNMDLDRAYFGHFGGRNENETYGIHCEQSDYFCYNNSGLQQIEYWCLGLGPGF